MEDKKINYNEPAFPSKDATGMGVYGMTLRDYFAVKAMHGIIITGNYPIEQGNEG